MAPLFTDATRATASADPVAALRSAIVDVIQLSSTADRTITAPILNHMLISVRYGNPPRKYPIRSASTLTRALTAVVASNSTRVDFRLNPAPIFIIPDAYTVMTFDGMSTTPFPNARVTGTGTNAAVTAAAAAAAAATTAATNANNFVAQQAATAATAAAALAAVSPTTFDHRNLPATVRQRHLDQLDPDYLMTQNDMSPFPISPGGVCESFNHIDPPLGSGVTPNLDSHRLIARNGQLFALADQDTAGWKRFSSSIPTCTGTSPDAIRKWYILFTQMAATCDFYVHPYYCFRKNAPSDTGFTCGFDTGPITEVVAAPETPHRPYRAPVLARLHVPATSTTAEITARDAVAEVLEILHVPAVLAVAAKAAVIHDLHGVFLARLAGWSSQISVALCNGKVFKYGTLQHTTLMQNSGNGYNALFQIISPYHPTLSNRASLLVRNPPSQTNLETLAMYYLRYLDYLGVRAFLEESRSNLNNSGELDKFIEGLCHSKALFRISREDRHSTDPHMVLKFKQGAVVTTLTHYLNELDLSNGPASSSASQYADDSDSDDDSGPSRYSLL